MKKKLLYAPGMRDVKSIHTAAVRSIPKAQRSSYLELYSLQREKERLEKEHYMLGKRDSSVTKRLEGIDKRIERFHQETQKGLKGNSSAKGKKTAKSLKTMRIHY